MLTNRSHPAFQHQPGHANSKIEYNTLFDEFAAAKVYGWETYWNAGREERAAMVAHTRIQDAIKVMSQYDEAEAVKTAAKRNKNG